MQQRYLSLIKPTRAPPPRLFGVVWSILYPIIIAVLWVVVTRRRKGSIGGRIVLPFVINIIANAIFTTIQFKLQSNGRAAVDIIIILVTIIWSMIAIRPHSKRLTYSQIPYLIRVSIATILQLQIRRLNR